MRSIHLFLLFILVSPLLSAQVKVEREYRIHWREVPADSRDWMRDAFEGIKKIRWYRDEQEDAFSYEAKLKWKGREYSVEFDADGRILDIEYKIDFEDIPVSARRNLEEYFNNEFRNFRLMKVQKQLTGDPDVLEDFMDEDEKDGITGRFEIEFYGERDDEKDLWEGLFDEKGEILLLRKMVLEPGLNLEF